LTNFDLFLNLCPYSLFTFSILSFPFFYCHQRRDDDSFVKLGDFGFSRRVHTPKSLITRCGTPTYVAPEILKNHPHDESVDMWSVGIVLFVLLVGYPPFMDDNQKILFRKIRLGDFKYLEEDWMDISPGARDLIDAFLTVDPLNRITASEALQHEWISELDDDDLSCNELDLSVSEIKRTIRDMEMSNAENAPWNAYPCLPN